MRPGVYMKKCRKMKKMRSEWIGSSIDSLFPRVCHVCGSQLGPGDRYVCASCLSALPRTHYHRLEDNPMERRFMGRFPFERAAGHFFYSRDSALAGLIHDFKYRSFRGLARMLGAMMGRELLSTGFLAEVEAVQPVPMYWFKRATRGYNQSREIALGFSSATGIPVIDAVRAVRAHRTQTSLREAERRRNLSGIFRVTDAEALRGRGILLLDDVCTTGATLAETARTIHEAASGVRLTMLTLGVTF